jgi:transcriptional regulator with XRE-family HTH domain
MPPQLTTEPFGVALRKLLAERDLSMRTLAREMGTFDHAYLSRMGNGKVSVNVEHAQQIARHLGLPADYFGEVRQARTIDAILRDPKLRDEIYYTRLSSPGTRPKARR